MTIVMLCLSITLGCAAVWLFFKTARKERAIQVALTCRKCNVTCGVSYCSACYGAMEAQKTPPGSWIKLGR